MPSGAPLRHPVRTQMALRGLMLNIIPFGRTSHRLSAGRIFRLQSLSPNLSDPDHQGSNSRPRRRGLCRHSVPSAVRSHPENNRKNSRSGYPYSDPLRESSQTNGLFPQMSPPWIGIIKLDIFISCFNYLITKVDGEGLYFYDLGPVDS